MHDLDLNQVKAISLDLDDTLWPIWPVIARAERALQDWLRPMAPRSAAALADADRRLALRQEIQRSRPELGHDLGTLRREIIRTTLARAGEDVSLVEPAYDVFYAERLRVELYEDVRPALSWLAGRYPVVAVSNGNADVRRVGLGEYFRAGLSAQDFGIGKPDARIFHAAALAAGVRPQEVLHVGDDALLDVIGGLRAGLQTAWVNRGGQAWSQPDGRPHVTVTDLGKLCAMMQTA